MQPSENSVPSSTVDSKPAPSRKFKKVLGCIGTGLISLVLLAMLDEGNRLRLLAAFGDSKAMYDMGMLVMRRNPNDIRPGVQWMVKSAEHGYTPAMFFLPSVGGHPDTDKIKWYLKGAESGDVFCMKEVGEAYEFGKLDAQRDLRKAEYWQRKSFALIKRQHGYDDATIQNELYRAFGAAKWPENNRPDLSNLPPP